MTSGDRALLLPSALAGHTVDLPADQRSARAAARLTELSYRNEMAAIWSAGVSPVRMMGMLLPFALLVGGLYFLINDRAVPAMAPTLREWGIGDYGEKRLKIGAARSDLDACRLRHLACGQRQCAGDTARRRDHLPPRRQRPFARTGLRQDVHTRRPLADVGRASSIIARTSREARLPSSIPAR